MEASMEESGGNFLLETCNRCFLCSEEAARGEENEMKEEGGNKSNLFYPFHSVAKYLKMCPKKVFIQPGMELPQNVLKKLDNLQLKVELCLGCGDLVEEMSALYQLFERVQQELGPRIRKMSEKLLLWEKLEEADEKNSRKIMLRKLIQEKSLDLASAKKKIEIVEAAREETLQKCKSLLETFPAHWLLDRVEESLPSSVLKQDTAPSTLVTPPLPSPPRRGHEIHTRSKTATIQSKTSPPKHPSKKEITHAGVSGSPSVPVPTSMPSLLKASFAKQSSLTVNTTKRFLKPLQNTKMPRLTPIVSVRNVKVEKDLHLHLTSTSTNNSAQGHSEETEEQQMETELPLRTPSYASPEDSRRSSCYDDYDDEDSSSRQSFPTIPADLEIEEAIIDDEDDDIIYEGDGNLPGSSRSTPSTSQGSSGSHHQPSGYFVYLPQNQKPSNSTANLPKQPEHSPNSHLNRRKQNFENDYQIPDDIVVLDSDDEDDVPRILTSIPVISSQVNIKVTPQFRCNVCKAFFDQPYKLQAHLRRSKACSASSSASTTQSNWEYYDCKLCKYRAIHFDHLKKHYETVHSPNLNPHGANLTNANTSAPNNFMGYHRCLPCGEWLPSLKHLLLHQRKFCNKRKLSFKCDVCHKGFLLKTSLNRHKKSHCSGYKATTLASPSNYQLEGVSIDEIPSTSASAIQQHFMEAVRPSTSQNGSSSNNDDLKDFNHYGSASDNMEICPTTQHYKCKVCYKKFPKRDSFVTHYNKFHGPPRYKCYLCNEKAFRTMKAMRIHSDRCLAQMKLPSGHGQGNNLGETEIVCKHCGKQFENLKELRYHAEEVHLGIVNHKCEICGKKFHFLSSWKRHRESVHFGVTYPCLPTCGRVFTDRSALTRHTKECSYYLQSGRPISYRHKRLIPATSLEAVSASPADVQGRPQNNNELTIGTTVVASGSMAPSFTNVISSGAPIILSSDVVSWDQYEDENEGNNNIVPVLLDVSNDTPSPTGNNNAYGEGNFNTNTIEEAEGDPLGMI